MGSHLLPTFHYIYVRVCGLQSVQDLWENDFRFGCLLGIGRDRQHNILPNVYPVSAYARAAELVAADQHHPVYIPYEFVLAARWDGGSGPGFHPEYGLHDIDGYVTPMGVRGIL